MIYIYGMKISKKRFIGRVRRVAVSHEIRPRPSNYRISSILDKNSTNQRITALLSIWITVSLTHESEVSNRRHTTRTEPESNHTILISNDHLMILTEIILKKWQRNGSFVLKKASNLSKTPSLSEAKMENIDNSYIHCRKRLITSRVIKSR